MKCIHKDIILKNELVESVKGEKDLLEDVDHPFIIKMHKAFSD